MAFTLKLKKSKAYNPSTKEYDYRTTVKANGRFGVDALTSGMNVELKGIGNPKTYYRTRYSPWVTENTFVEQYQKIREKF